jgi:uncharacterized membrane protein YcaP (DUF421 family)
VDGTPVMIFCKGQWERERMQQLCVDAQDVMAAARSQGMERLEQIKYVIVERNGGISVLKKIGEI